MHAASDKLFDRRLALQFLFIATVVAIPFGIGTAPRIFRDGDSSWHVAAGRWIINHWQIPTTDPFSFTAGGHPWVTTEWLAEIVYASSFALAGYAGLATIVAASLIALHSVLFFYLQRRVSPIIVVTTLLCLDLVLSRFVLARPHVLAWPLIAAWTVTLLQANEAGSPPPPWTVLILIVWTNLHASFPLALLILGGVGLDSVLKAKWTNVRQWLAFAALSMVALMLNANGIAGLLQPFKISSLSMLNSIGEWHPSSPQISPFFFAELLVGIGMLLWFSIRIQLGSLLLLLTTLGLAFAHLRHQTSFAIIAACIVPTLFESRPSGATISSPFLLTAAPLLILRLLLPVLPPETTANPAGLIARIPPQVRDEPVFNEYTFGGPLILAGVKPFIDGRAEIYGDSFVANYMDIADGDLRAFYRAADRYGIRWTLLSHRKNERLIADLDASPDWQRVYSDGVGAIHIRRLATKPPAIRN